MNPQLDALLKRTISSGKLISSSLPLCDAISLFLLSPDYPQGRLDDEEMQAIMNRPAYWAFCWASGQVLAHFIMQHRELVKGKQVLDLGCGSGVVGIAAALKGAKAVIACDNDPDALIAAEANARTNGVKLQLLADLSELSGHIDMVIAADVLYDRDNLPLLNALPGIASEVIVADSRIKNIPLYGYEKIFSSSATTIPDLDEFREFNQVKVYRALPPGFSAHKDSE